MTTPVSPMPPTVAQNRSGSWVGLTVTAPVGVTRRISSTWRANVPSTWWFFPCTSAAIAPPKVTWRVPGVTGTNQPWGIETASSSSTETPAPTLTTPASSMAPIPPRSRLLSTTPPPTWAGVAVAASEPARDHRARAGQCLGDGLFGRRV